MPHRTAPKISSRQKPIVGGERLGRRQAVALLAIRLRSIHPNPGPDGRDKSVEGLAARRERRRRKRQERRQERRQEERVVEVEGDRKEWVLVTWNGVEWEVEGES